MNGSVAVDTANTDYQGLVLDYVRSADQDAPSPVRHPVVVKSSTGCPAIRPPARPPVRA